MSAALDTLTATAIFAAANVLLARGSRTRLMRDAVRLSIYLGLLFFFLIAIISGQLKPLTAENFFLFAISGVLHFAIGRSAMYEAILLLGASRAIVFIALSPVFSLFLAVLLFHEYLGPVAIVGAILAISGPILASRHRGSGSRVLIGTAQWSRGITLALVAAVCWGISPILIKRGLQHGVPVLSGAFISHAAAVAVVAAQSFIAREKKANQSPFQLRDNFYFWFLLAAIFTNIGQFLLYRALDTGDITTYVVLLQLTPIFTTIFTLIVNRNVEKVPFEVVLGGVLAVLGSMAVVAVR